MTKALLLSFSLLTVIFTANAQITTLKSFYETTFEGVKQLNNGNIIFQAKATGDNHQVWVTDGTATGTNALTNFCPSAFINVFDPFTDVFYKGVHSDGIYYYGMMKTNCSNLNEMKIFKTDGNAITYSAPNGTAGNNASWYNIYDSLSVGSKIYFFHLAKEIYAFDKNTGTISLDYGPGNPYPSANSDVRFLKRDGNDLLLFFHNSGINNSLVRFNTSGKTVTDIFNFGQYYQNLTGYNNTKPDFYNYYSHESGYNPNVFTWNNETYFFIRYQDQNLSRYYALWKTDGTAGGTKEVKSFATPSSVNLDGGVSFIPFNNKLYFTFSDKTKTGLWSTDGTTAGTLILKALNTDTVFHNFVSTMSNIIELNGKLYFLGAGSTGDLELYESDGTPAGTKKSFEFIPGNDGLMDKNQVFQILYKFNNRIYFTGSMFPGYKQIISTDGTLEGTYSLGGNFSTSMSPIIQKNDDLLFTSKESYDKHHLHKLSLTNAKPLFLNHAATAAKGQTMTVTGYDLRNTDQVYLFDHNGTSYYYAQNMIQLNDTAVSFTVPSTLSINSFKVAARTKQGTFISKNYINIGPVSVNEIEQETLYQIANSEEKFIVKVADIVKPYQIRLIDIKGRTLINMEATGSFEIEKNQFVPGLYILMINNRTEKLVIQ